MTSTGTLMARAGNGSHLDFNIYGYLPSLAAGVAFLVLFSLLTAVHFGIVLRSRVWWLMVLVVGGLCEVLGWAGRTWSHINVYNLNAFLIQQCLLILGPCFFSAAAYGITGSLIRAVGPEHSRLRPSWYLWIFCSADLVAIIVQAVGGALSATALGNDASSDTGTHAMVAGIVLQLVAMIAFCALGLDFVYKARRDPAYAGKFGVEGGRVGLLVWSLGWASGWILVRCVYRVVELAQGWGGYLLSHEPYFICLDAIPMVFCMAGLVAAHPHFCLPEHSTLSSDKLRPISSDEKAGEV